MTCMSPRLLLRRALSDFVWKAKEDEVFAKRFSVMNRRWRLPYSLEYEPDQGLMLMTQEGNSLAIARRARVRTEFAHGFLRRQQGLFANYFLNCIDFIPGDVVVDVGANIGEISKMLLERFGVYPVAIEPDPREFSALQWNLRGSNSLAFQALLMHESGEMNFYDANDSGDSSVFAPTTQATFNKVLTRTLDEVMSEFVGTSRVKLIKIEAEGAEPEVIMGAAETLKRTDYVTVDVGPERGLNRETTLVQCTNLLSEAGFRPLRFGHGRLVMLYEHVA